MIGGNQMIGPLREFISPFQITTRVRVRDCTTTMRRRYDGAVDIWALSDSLSSPVALSFQEVPIATLDSPVMNWYARLPKPEKHLIRRSTQSVVSSHYKANTHPLFHLKIQTLSQRSLFPDPLSLFRGNGPSSISPLYCPDLAATVTAFFCFLIFTG